MPDLDTPVAVLLSGGLDSAVLVALAAREYTRVHPLYVRCGLRWEPAERQAALRFLEALAEPTIAPLVEIELPVGDIYGNHWSLDGGHVPDHNTPDEAVYLPGRNLLLLAKAAVYCRLNRIGRVALGPLKNNPFADSTPEFFADYQAALNRALGGRLEILRPLEQLTKPEVVRLGAHLPLQWTLSCMQPQPAAHVSRKSGRPPFPAGLRDDFPLHCGRCNKCAERRRAFREAGIPDRALYATATPDEPAAPSAASPSL